MGSGDIKVRVELPVDWFINPVDGNRHRTFMANVLAALVNITPSIELVKVPWGADFAERSPPPGGVLFSYHSVGSVPGVWRMKEAPIPPLYSIDKGGHSGWSQIAKSRALQQKAKAFDLGAAKQIIETYRERFKATRLSKYPQSETSEELPERFVFVPLQLPNDPVSLFARFNAISLLTEASRVAEEQQKHVVVKRHPFCTSVGIETCVADLAKSNPYFHLSTGNVHQLIEKSMSVLTVNSGVGLEALIHGKPVYSCGLSEWQSAAHAVVSVDGIKDAFRTEQPEMSDEAKSYIGFLLSEYWVDSTSFDKIVGRVKHCIEASPESDDVIDAPRDEALEILYQAAGEGDIRRNFRQLQMDFDYIRDTDAKRERELARVTGALETEQMSLVAASEKLTEATEEIAKLEAIIDQLREQLSGAEAKLANFRKNPVKSAVSIIRGKSP